MKVLPPQDREEMVFRIIKRLLAQKGIVRYEIIYTTEEADHDLPGGIYPESGTVVTEDGHIYSYWFDWDEKKQDYTLGNDKVLPDGTTYSFWHEVDPKDYEYDEEYQEARKKLGLT